MKRSESSKINWGEIGSYVRENGDLILAGKKVGDEEVGQICKFLRENPAVVVKLDLRKNKIGPEGAKIIADYIKTDPELEDLYLSENPLKHLGVSEISSALKTNSTLCSLRLTSVGMKIETTAIFCDALQRNATFKSCDFIHPVRGNRDNIHKSRGQFIETKALLEENSKFPEQACARMVAYQLHDRLIGDKEYNIEEELYFLECYEKVDKELLSEKFVSLFGRSLDEFEEELNVFSKKTVVDRIIEGKELEKALTRDEDELARKIMDKLDPRFLDNKVLDFIRFNEKAAVKALALKQELADTTMKFIEFYGKDIEGYVEKGEVKKAPEISEEVLIILSNILRLVPKSQD